MFNREQLSEMSDEALKAVAENLGIKKIDLDKKEKLVYDILDSQAAKGAAEDIAGNAARRRRKDNDNATEPKKRGRKKKQPEAEKIEDTKKPKISTAMILRQRRTLLPQKTLPPS